MILTAEEFRARSRLSALMSAVRRRTDQEAPQAQIARQRLPFKPRIDNRFSETEIVSHNEQNSFNCCRTAEQIYFSNSWRLSVDEAQFFDTTL
jgi:thymidine kinase